MEEDKTAEGNQELRELRQRVEDLQRELGRLEGRQKLMDEERDRLLLELEEERVERHRLELELEAALERDRVGRISWWRRIFGR